MTAKHKPAGQNPSQHETTQEYCKLTCQCFFQRTSAFSTESAGQCQDLKLWPMKFRDNFGTDIYSDMKTSHYHLRFCALRFKFNRQLWSELEGAALKSWISPQILPCSKFLVPECLVYPAPKQPSKNGLAWPGSQLLAFVLIWKRKYLLHSFETFIQLKTGFG